MWFLPLLSFVRSNWKLGLIALVVLLLGYVGLGIEHQIQAKARAEQFEKDKQYIGQIYLDQTEVVVAQRDSVSRQLDSLKKTAPQAIIRWRTVTQHDGTTVTPADSSRHAVPLPDSVIVAGNELADQLGKCLSGCDQFRADTKVKERADSVRIERAEYRADSVLSASHAGRYLKAGVVGAVLGAVAGFVLRHR